MDERSSPPQHECDLILTNLITCANPFPGTGVRTPACECGWWEAGDTVQPIARESSEVGPEHGRTHRFQSRTEEVDKKQGGREEENRKNEDARKESVSRIVEGSSKERTEKHLEVTGDFGGLTSERNERGRIRSKDCRTGKPGASEDRIGGSRVAANEKIKHHGFFPAEGRDR